MQAHIAALIADVKALDAQATPGPWRVEGASIRVNLLGGIEYQWASAAYPRDNNLIARYRTAAPLLAAEVERQDEEIYILRACWRAAREAEQRAQDLLAAEREARARQEAERRAMLAADAVKP